VRIVDISRMPVRLISSVRGIGVADIVRTSTAVRICLMNSLCSTPKRCSSSTMTRPRSLNCVLLRQQAVGADDDVDLAARDAVHDLLLLPVGVEAADGAHGDREGLEAVAEGVVVLLHQQRRRHEDGDLLAVLHGLEGGAHGDLGLAVADVAHDDAVHRDRPSPCPP
jgi:hypothetical protein